MSTAEVHSLRTDAAKNSELRVAASRHSPRLRPVRKVAKRMLKRSAHPPGQPAALQLLEHGVAAAPRSTEHFTGISEVSLRNELVQIKATEVSECVRRWAETYSEVGHRSRYLWTWATRGAELTTLPSVAPEWRTHVRDTKVLSIMVCVLLDDVADGQKRQPLLGALLDIVEHRPPVCMNRLSKTDRHYASVTQKLCTAYDRRIRQYPYYRVYNELLQYDVMQFINTMRYSSLLNRLPALLNLAEHEIYFPHNMHMMSFATLDLMCSPDFQVNDLGRLREAVWHSQCMGRVGNLLSTWRRELSEGDFTSDVFARAVSQGDLSLEQLSVSDRAEIEQAIHKGDHEKFFFIKWKYHKSRFKALAKLIRSVDLQQCIEGHQHFLYMHLASRGLI